MLRSELAISVIQGRDGTREPHGEPFQTKKMPPGGNKDLKNGLRLTSRNGRTRVIQVEKCAHVTVGVRHRNRVKMREREGVLRHETFIVNRSWTIG